MQGAQPLASPGLNPRGTGKGGEPRTRRGACPRRCRLTLPLWYSQGACLVYHLPTLPFAFLFAPYPPTPFPGGEGGDSRLFHARGFAPCIPKAEPARHWERGRTTHPAGVCLVCRPPTPPLVYFFAPIPPTPFPGGEGGDSRLFHARGFAPCIPKAEPARHWERGRTTHPAGVCLVCRPPTPPLVYFFAPIPPTPFPGGEGGDSRLFHARGFAPCIPGGLNPGGTCTTKGFCLFTGGQCRQPRRGGTGGEELRRLRWSSPPGQG